MPRTRRVLLSGGTHDRARRVDQALERSRPALHLDQNRRPDHRPHLPLLLTHLRTGTLAAPDPGVAERSAAGDRAGGVLLLAAVVDHDDLSRALRAQRCPVGAGGAVV